VNKAPSTTATVLSLSKKTILDIGPDAMWYLDTAEIGDSQFALLLFDKRKQHWRVKYMSKCHYYDKSFGQRDTKTPTQLGFHKPAFFLRHSDEYTPQRYAKSIALSSDPEVEEFVILGYDGLWKCFGNEGMDQTNEMQTEQELLLFVQKAHRSWQESSYIPGENFVSWLGKDIRKKCDACDITQSNDDRVFLLASICTRSMAKGCPRQDFCAKTLLSSPSTTTTYRMSFTRALCWRKSYLLAESVRMRFFRVNGQSVGLYLPSRTLTRVRFFRLGRFN